MMVQRGIKVTPTFQLFRNGATDVLAGTNEKKLLRVSAALVRLGLGLRVWDLIAARPLAKTVASLLRAGWLLGMSALPTVHRPAAHGFSGRAVAALRRVVCGGASP